MSGYFHEYDLGGCNPHAHFRQPISAGPLTAFDFDEDDFTPDFDAEIEPEQLHVASPPSPAAPRTMSQRILQSVQQHRTQSRSAATASLPPHRHTSRAVERTLGNSMFEVRSMAKKKASLASTVTMTDAVLDTSLSSRSRSSCTDRLEARISKSFLAQRGNGPGRQAQDLSLLCSGRETFSTESVRKTEHARLSDNRFSNAPTPQETKMLEIMDKERAIRVFRPQMDCREIVSGVKKNNGVMFHFRRGPSVKNDVLEGRMERLALTNGRADARVANALVKVQSSKRVTTPDYTALAFQLAETESLVDSIESCMKKPSFSKPAAHVLKEMQLIVKTTQQIRTNGTTLILANVGKHQNADFMQALRRLVARAASVQKRIGALINAINQLVV